MLSLDSPMWQELADAYGPSSEIPELLRELESFPPDLEPEAEPYFSLWSALCHQGDVYTASYAAVPHLVRVAALAPERVPWSVFQMVACIEIARMQGRGPVIPPALEASYRAALAMVPEVVGCAAKTSWDHSYCGAALAAIAAAKGFCQYAEAILELDPETIEDLLERKCNE